MGTIKASYFRHTLQFIHPAGTSRGVMRNRDTWFLLLEKEGRKALGECAMFRGLSCDDLPGYESRLSGICHSLNQGKNVAPDDFIEYPSLRFGLETALGRLRAAEKGEEYLDSDFTRGRAAIPVNGLVWMGDFEQMSARMEEKLSQGYRCIKIKIGAIDFEDELRLIAAIRRRWGKTDVEIRVDANGAFSPENALRHLDRLSKHQLHSIEQPIRAGQPEAMARLCRTSPLPVALDEELIGIHSPEEKQRLLDYVRPQYIVIKPSLVGGILASREWIDAAQAAGAGYWITSALESNVGLDAIARFCYLCSPSIAQGLGTGGLYTNNVAYPFAISAGMFRITGRVPDAETVLRALHQNEHNG